MYYGYSPDTPEEAGCSLLILIVLFIIIGICVYDNDVRCIETIPYETKPGIWKVTNCHLDDFMYEHKGHIINVIPEPGKYSTGYTIEVDE